MKRIRLTIIMTLILFGFYLNVSAFEIKLLDLREKLFLESSQIKQEINPETKDFVLLSGLFDSCIQIVTQIDAYFYMLGIFEFIPQEKLNKTAFNFLFSWLDIIKKTNDLNIKNLKTATPVMEESTKSHIEKIKTYFTELDRQIIRERSRLNLLIRSLNIR